MCLRIQKISFKSFDSGLGKISLKKYKNRNIRRENNVFCGVPVRSEILDSMNEKISVKMWLNHLSCNIRPMRTTNSS